MLSINGAGPLRDYLDSLNLVRGLPDRRLLPAHGPVAPSVHARVDELIEHHDTRLHQIDETIDAGAHTASDAARRLLWTRRGNEFTELDLLGRKGTIAGTGVCDAKWQNLNRARRLIIEWTAQL